MTSTCLQVYPITLVVDRGYSTEITAVLRILSIEFGGVALLGESV